MMIQKGHFFCKKIAYEIDGEFKTISHCHCESCRRSHSSAFVSWGSVERTRFKLVTGQELLKKHESSPDNYRIFCSNCGSQLFGEYGSDPDIIYITLGSLESDPVPYPDKHYSYEEKVAWFDFQDALPKFRQKTNEGIDG